MLPPKPNKLPQNLVAKLSNKLLVWQSLSPQIPALLLVIIFGLIIYSQPMAGQGVKAVQTAHQNLTTHPAATPKVSQPVASAPVAPPLTATPAPSTRTASPVAIAPRTTQAGTPKTEPVVTPAPTSSVSGLTPTTTPAPSSQSPAPAAPTTTTSYLSTNWSGYLATTGSFSGISGSWTATKASGNGSSTSADSTWIGIGGVTSGDLIQVGTENIISASGVVSTSAFYELLPAYAQIIPSVSVSPGDSLSASLAEINGAQWDITITDKTDDQSFTTTVSYNSSLSSAEWIEEDPSYSFRRQIPFDNFQEASFTNGSTTANQLVLSIAASTAQPVTMVDGNGQPIALPSTIGPDGASFSVTP